MITLMVIVSCVVDHFKDLS